MPSASTSIAEPTTSPNARLYFGLRLRTPAGEPLSGVEVRFNLEGDGSLASQFSSKEVIRESDEDGAVSVIWFRQGIWQRGVKATLTANAPAEAASFELNQLAPAEFDTGAWISWAPRRTKF